MKLSKAHQAAIDAKNAAQREALAYHHILTAIARDNGRWGSLQRVGSAYERGDSWVWQLALTPRLRDAVIMETFDCTTNGGKTVRCFFLPDIASAYEGHSFESTSIPGKIQALYFRAVEMQRMASRQENE
jgi:hypothetical protein